MEDLIYKARMGDGDAFAKAITDQMQNLYKAARSILKNEEDVADAISDTILACWEKIGQLQEERYFRTWMTRILINKCRDIYRKKELLFISQEVPEVEYHESGYENLEWLEALESVDEKYRTVIILYYVEGFKTAEISQILEMPEATVRTRLARAREKMAAEYYPECRRRTV